MEVQDGDWLPCHPVSVCQFVTAFVEVSRPLLSREISQVSEEVFCDGRWDLEAHLPCVVALPFLGDESRGSQRDNLFADLRRQLVEVREAVACACAVSDEVAEECSSRAHFEVQVSLVRQWPEEEFDA